MNTIEINKFNNCDSETSICKLYRSENGLFIFNNPEECKKYDSFGIIKFKNLFLEIEDSRFVLLDLKLDKDTQIMYAMLQALNVSIGEMMCVNSYELWKITYNYSSQESLFETKQGTYDSVYCDMDHDSANATGWFPFWKNSYINEYYAPVPTEFSEEAFITFIKTSLVNYYTAFGHLDEFRQQELSESLKRLKELRLFISEMESSVDNIENNYGFDLIKWSESEPYWCIFACEHGNRGVSAIEGVCAIGGDFCIGREENFHKVLDVLAESKWKVYFHTGYFMD